MNGPLKSRLSDLYSGKSHMECYHFCQHCEDHFDTASATGPHRTPFAASFLRGRISFRWHQHKRRVRECLHRLKLSLKLSFERISATTLAIRLRRAEPGLFYIGFRLLFLRRTSGQYRRPALSAECLGLMRPALSLSISLSAAIFS